MICALAIGEQGLGFGSSIAAPVIVPYADRPSAEIALLVEIALSGGGPTLLLSDRAVVVAGRAYEAYIDEVSGLGSMLMRADSSALNPDVRISLLSDAYADCAHLALIAEAHPFEAALCVIRQAFLSSSGEAISVSEVFRGSLDEPRSIGPLGFIISASSIERSVDRLWN